MHEQAETNFELIQRKESCGHENNFFYLKFKLIFDLSAVGGSFEVISGFVVESGG